MPRQLTLRAPLTTPLLRAILLGLALLCVWTAPALAQDEEDEPSIRVVLMPVPDGGTRMVAEHLLEIDGIDLQPSKFLYKEARKRGFKKKRLFRKSKDLRFVMTRAKIDLIIGFGKDGDLYEVKFITSDKGKVTHTFSVERTEDGVTESGAADIRSEVKNVFKDRFEDTPAKPLGGSDAPRDPEDEEGGEKPDKKAPEDEDTQDTLRETPRQPGEAPQDWVSVSVRGRLLKRDMTVGGQTGTVLSYNSRFYPGYEVSAEVFPLVFTDQDFTAIGLYMDFVQGFDSVEFVGSMGNAQALPVTHLHIEGGASLRLDTPRRTELDGDFIRVRLRLTVRHSRFSIEDNLQLPSISNTAIVGSGKISYPMFFPGFALEGGIEFIPVSFWGDGQTRFGQSSYTYGMGTSLGGLFSVSDAISVSFGYAFGLHRTAFEGVGEMNFEGANAFELIQGLNAGVTWRQ